MTPDLPEDGSPSGRTRPAPPKRSAHLSGSPLSLEPQHLYKAVALLFLLLIFHAHFDAVARVLLIVYTAAIFGVAMNVIVGLLPQHRRLLSAALGVVIFAMIGVLGWIAIPALTRQLRGFVAEIPRMIERLRGLTDYVRSVTGLNINLFGGDGQQLAGLFDGVQVLGTAYTFGEALIVLAMIVLGGLYAVAKPNDRLLSPLLHIVPADRRDSFRRVILLLGHRLTGWVKGMLIAMVAVGALSALGLWALGVRYSLLLGVISAMMELVPFLGPFVAGGLAVGVALLDSPSTAFWVALLMLIIQQAEANFITPMVMAQTAEVHPFVTIFAIFFFGSIFGFLGVLLAIPLVLLVWTAVEVLWVERALHSNGERIEPIVKE